jgi:hypothetical protein
LLIQSHAGICADAPWISVVNTRMGTVIHPR